MPSSTMPFNVHYWNREPSLKKIKNNPHLGQAPSTPPLISPTKYPVVSAPVVSAVEVDGCLFIYLASTN